MKLSEVPDWVTFPEGDWIQISPKEAGLDGEKLGQVLAGLDVKGAAYGGEVHEENNWGAVLTRGGYLVNTWGDGSYKFQSASLGKAFTFALLGLAEQEGLVRADDPIHKTWTGEEQLSHPHKYLDQGHHKNLTWRHLVGGKYDNKHYGGFPIEIGYYWKLGHSELSNEDADRWVPQWANWTGDPFYDNYSHVEPNTIGHYSSGGFWRISQPLTYLWDRDLKEVIDEKLLSKIGISPDRWEWLPGRAVQQDKDFYPLMPYAWDYLDPPYEITGHVVRSGPGWIVMSVKDIARFGHLVATQGNWKGEQLIDPRWLRGHGGGNGSGVCGESKYYTAMGMVTTQGINHPFSTARESFLPEDMFVGPAKVTRTI